MRLILYITIIFSIHTISSCKKEASTNEPAWLKENLLAYYPFFGNANDSSGNSNHGKVNGAILTTDRFGNSNNAYAFDGINDNILIENSQSLNPTSISISGWFNTVTLPTDQNSGASAIISKWYQVVNCSNNGDNYTIILANVNGRNVLAGATSINPLLSNSITSDFTIQQQNQWVHFTFIHDSLSGQKIYINGSLVNLNNIKGGLCKTTNPILIGADNRGNSQLWRFMKGKIDDIRIYGRTLTEYEINYLATH